MFGGIRHPTNLRLPGTWNLLLRYPVLMKNKTES
jgi:hypothetical protein